MSVRRNEGKKLGEGNRSLTEGQVVSLFGGEVVQVDADEAGGKPTQMLGVVNQAERFFGGGVAEVVPVAEGGGGQAREEQVPSVVGGNLARIFAALQTQLQAESSGAFPQPKQDFLHAGPTFLKGFFPRGDGGEFLADISAGAHLAAGGEEFERVGPVVGAGGAEMKNDQAGADAGGGLERGEGVAFSQAAGGRAWIGKFIGVGVWAEQFHGDGTKVVQDIDLGGGGGFGLGENARPKVKACVVTEFDAVEAEFGSLLKKRGTLGGAVGMPAGGKGEGGRRHSGEFP